jgi:exosortase
MDTATAVAEPDPGVRFRFELWKWGKIGLVVGLLAALFAHVVPDLVSDWWNDSESSYGMLIPPIALYLAYSNRRWTLAVPPQPTLKGLWLVGLGCLVFLLGSLSSEFFLARISLVILLTGFIWTFWGTARFRTLAFPLVLLATMVPLPAIVYNSLAAPLQLFASALATDLAQALGVSVYRDGNIIHLANTSLGVAEACSGLHSLSAMMVASLLLGFVHQMNVGRRILLFLLSVPLAISINVLRITGTALLADYQADFALGFYHSFTGWLVFVLGFGGLWVTAKMLLPWTRTGSPRASV